MLDLHLKHLTYEWLRENINEGDYLIVGKTEVGSILIPMGSQDVKIDIWGRKKTRNCWSFLKQWLIMVGVNSQRIIIKLRAMKSI